MKANDVKIFGIKGGPIAGVEMTPLAIIPDERGAIFHMLRNDDPLFKGFGEIYFSMIYPEAIKAWHYHHKMTLNYAVISGMIKLVLFDDRDGSPTKGNLMEVFTGEKNYLRIQVPPGVWNGYKGIAGKPALVANCATLAHDPTEMDRKDPFCKDIPYNWERKDE